MQILKTTFVARYRKDKCEARNVGIKKLCARSKSEKGNLKESTVSPHTLDVAITKLET